MTIEIIKYFYNLNSNYFNIPFTIIVGIRPTQNLILQSYIVYYISLNKPKQTFE